MGVDDALSEQKTSLETGLSKDEVKRRQDEHGLNELPTDEGINWVQLVVSQFNDVMIIILIVAAVISAFLGESSDVIIILVIVVLNAVLGIYQEFQAEQALASLSAMQVPLVTVRRDGEVREIQAEQLVPGDIVLLDEGARIPADGRIIENINMRVEEAALTGESEAVSKQSDPITGTGDVAIGDRKNMVYMGTSVTAGRGAIVVTETGLKTELGNIAAMLLQVEEGITPLQKRLNQLGKTLAAGAVLVIMIVFIAGVAVRGIPVEEMFLVAVSLAVAAVPEGLPALVTISLSLGASRMVQRNALIRRLPAVETLGSVTVICSDKTGTLTRNEMTATTLALPGHGDVEVSGIGYTPMGDFMLEQTNEKLDPKDDEQVARFIKAMALSTNAHLEMRGEDNFTVVGDTTEGALVVAAEKVGWSRSQLEKDLPRVAELPFSSDRKAMTTVHEVVGDEARQLFPNTKYISITKGAPDQLINWGGSEQEPQGPDTLDEERKNHWQGYVDQMASEGLRVLGVAYRSLDGVPDELDESIERDLTLLGLVGIVDPARPEASEAVKKARTAGIRSLMITGDHALTAEAIARDLGILEEGQHAVTGAQINKMSDSELKAALKETSAFARVSPAHKLRVVKVLQEEGNVVAMTGDGVNDAPALKQADIGVAMGITGTDVSKGASEMVLTDDNFASIVSAVEEGRTIFDNIRKFIKYLLSSNVGEILVMFVAILAGLKIPLLAIQILWINLVTDGLPAIALGFEDTEEGVMDREPRSTDESIFAGGVGGHIVRIGILIAVLTLGGFVYGFTSNGMDPLSDTLGLEDFNRAELVQLVDDEELVPAEWDELETEERISLLEGEAGEEGAAFEEEAGDGIMGAAEAIPRTIAFTILAFTQMFEVMAIHAGDRSSFFKEFFAKNTLLMWAVLSTFLLQLAVIYLPFAQEIFRTAPLSAGELLLTAVLGSVILFAVELEKIYITRNEDRQRATAAS